VGAASSGGCCEHQQALPDSRTGRAPDARAASGARPVDI